MAADNLHLNTLGLAFGPLAAGAVFDQYGSHGPFLLHSAALMGMSSIALFSSGTAPAAELERAESQY